MFARFATALSIAMLLGSTALAADEPQASPSESAVPASNADAIAELVKQLNSPKFADRQNASLELRAAGKAAIPALIEAAQSGNREATTRAVDVLKGHFKDGSPDTKQMAKEALEKLAAGGSPAAAKLAEDALRPMPDPADAPLQAQPGRVIIVNGGQIQIAGGPIQIQVQAIAGPGRRVQVRNNNGVKDTEVEENGRKVKIHEEPAGKIEIEVTEKKDGKETTEKYEAKNLDELKKNHPDAHKIYEQYNQGNGRIQIQAVPGNALPVFPVPGQPGVPNIRPAPQPINPANLQKLRDAQQKLRDAAQELQRAAKLPIDTDEAKKAHEEANQKAKAELEEAQKEIRAAIEGLRAVQPAIPVLPQAIPLPVLPAVPVPALPEAVE